MRPDVSTIKGFVGQAGWARKWDGKASAQRDNATPVLYMHPSAGGSGHVVFNLETQTKQITYSLSISSDPGACSLLLAESTLCRPRGAYGTPKRGIYADCLRAMLVPRSHMELTMVRHDPLTGMPESLYAVEPCVGPTGGSRCAPLVGCRPWMPGAHAGAAEGGDASGPEEDGEPPAGGGPMGCG